MGNEKGFALFGNDQQSGWLNGKPSKRCVWKLYDACDDIGSITSKIV